MALFPALKSGAVAQYPTERSREYSTAVCEFVGGGEQRFARSASGARQWAIRLERLDEAELLRLEDFFIAQGGAAGSFSFTDPFDGAEYADCSFADDELEIEFVGVQDGRSRMVVRENV